MLAKTLSSWFSDESQGNIVTRVEPDKASADEWVGEDGLVIRNEVVVTLGLEEQPDWLGSAERWRYLVFFLSWRGSFASKEEISWDVGEVAWPRLEEVGSVRVKSIRAKDSGSIAKNLDHFICFAIKARSILSTENKEWNKKMRKKNKREKRERKKGEIE